jgi:hypothetical protein
MWYEHPNRFPKNAPGPFYTLGYVATNGTVCGQCMACGAPEAEATDLLASLTNENLDTYFVRQPTTPEEVKLACSAIQICCIAALRYGGTDPLIIWRLGNTDIYSDYILVRGKLLFVGGPHQPRWWRRGWRWLRYWFTSTHC